LTMMPGTHDQKYFVVICVLRLDRLVNRDGAIDVFLVPQAVHQHDRDFQRLSCKYSIHRLVTPKGIVTGMRKHLPPETNLFESVTTSKFAGRTCFHVHVVVVEMIGPPLGFVLAGRLLLIYVSHV